MVRTELLAVLVVVVRMREVLELVYLVKEIMVGVINMTNLVVEVEKVVLEV